MNLGSEDNKEDEFVLTAPDYIRNQIMARSTIGALIEIIANAKFEIVLSFPFINMDGELTEKTIIAALESALKRNVIINIISTGKSIQYIRSNIDLFKNKNIHFFRPKSNMDNDNQLGSHAKFCLTDSASVYIGSANLTWTGLINNFEMGILLHGRLAKKVSKFWNLLIDEDLIMEV